MELTTNIWLARHWAQTPQESRLGTQNQWESSMRLEMLSQKQNGQVKLRSHLDGYLGRPAAVTQPQPLPRGSSTYRSESTRARPYSRLPSRLIMTLLSLCLASVSLRPRKRHPRTVLSRAYSLIRNYLPIIRIMSSTSHTTSILSKRFRPFKS